MSENKPSFAWTAIEWAGTTFSILAAVTMAVFGQSHVEYQIYIFIAYFLGSLLWMLAAIKMKKGSLWTMNLVFLVINIIGIANRI